MSAEATSYWKILGVGGVIYALLILSLILSSLFLGGWWPVVFAVGIATVQAIIIAIFSMELFASSRSIVVIALIAPLFVTLLVGLTVVEVYTREPPALLPPEIDKTLPLVGP